MGQSWSFAKFHNAKHRLLHQLHGHAGLERPKSGTFLSSSHLQTRHPLSVFFWANLSSSFPSLSSPPLFSSMFLWQKNGKGKSSKIYEYKSVAWFLHIGFFFFFHSKREIPNGKNKAIKMKEPKRAWNVYFETHDMQIYPYRWSLVLARHTLWGFFPVGYIFIDRKVNFL